jgi:hypothetical protein
MKGAMCDLSFLVFLWHTALCAPAADIQWTGAVDQRFQNTNNWLGGVIPGPQDDLIIGKADLGLHDLAILDGDAVEVTAVRIGEMDGQRGSRSMIVAGGHVAATEIVLAADQNFESADLLAGGGTLDVGAISMLSLGGASIQVEIRDATMNVGARGLSTAAPSPEAAQYVIRMDSPSDRIGGMIDLTAAGVGAFAGVQDQLEIVLDAGTLRVAGNIQDISELSPHVMLTTNRACRGVRIVYHYDEATDATDIFLGVPGVGPDELLPGDADQDGDFDQLDIVKVQQSGKYLTGVAATWGEGDWDGAPGGAAGDPPPGDGFFDQNDIVAALLTDAYSAQSCNAGLPRDHGNTGRRTSIIYNSLTGEVGLVVQSSLPLTSIHVNSTAGIFTGSPAENLGGPFDIDADNTIFKATFGSSFGSLSFGAVAQPGLAQDFLLSDLTVSGSLAGGGGLGDLEMVYIPIPEPATNGLLYSALLALVAHLFGESYREARRSRRPKIR